MTTSSSKQPIDVFVSYSVNDRSLANQVASGLAEHGLNVFVDADQVGSGAVWEKKIWHAIGESKAMVVINPNIPNNPWQGIEVGAATAWSKPIFCLTSYDYDQEIPTSILRVARLFRPDQLSELANAVKESFQSFTKEETELLVDSYIRLGMPLDALTSQPSHLDKLTRNFVSKSGRSVSVEQILSKLLRLRKQGRIKASV